MTLGETLGESKLSFTKHTIIAYCFFIEKRESIKTVGGLWALE